MECATMHRLKRYSEANIPEGPEYEKNINTKIGAREEVLTTPHRNNDSCCDL